VIEGEADDNRVLWGICMTFMGFVHNWSGLMAARVCYEVLRFGEGIVNGL
jgi:hypothetical protein